jgi:hypothetical protein
MKEKNTILRGIVQIIKKLLSLAVISILLNYLFSIAFFYIKTGELRFSYTNQQLEEYIKSDFDKNYKLDILEEKLWNFGELSYIVFADDKKQIDYCISLLDKGGNLTLLPPIIRIYDKKNDFLTKLFPYIPPIKIAFEFKMTFTEKEKDWEDLFISQKRIIDLDGDGKKEVILRLMTPTCGSTAEIFNFVFSRTENEYNFTATFPESSYFKEGMMGDFNGSKINSVEELFRLAIEKKWKPVNLFDSKNVFVNGKEQEILFGTTDDYFDFTDIDNDGTYEAIVAKMDWKFSDDCFKEGMETNPNCECHWCPHNWLIGVFKYKNGEFIVDNKFNDGLLLPTKEKYDLYDIMGYRPYPVNMFGVVSGYYGLGFYGMRNEDFSFNFLDRNKSKVLDIIEKHYTK